MVYLIVSIDVEEDDWGDYQRREGCNLTNVGHLPKLQELFDRYEIKPTYLIDYPVAKDDMSIEFFNILIKNGRAEIGSHLHPWNTPPFEEEANKYNSIMTNLPFELKRSKIFALTEIIKKNLSIRPTSFRGGRFCFDHRTLLILSELDYLVDCSVTPFIDWSEDYGGIDFRDYPYYPYKMAIGRVINSHHEDGVLFEVPVTIGFNRTPFNLYNSIYNFLGKKGLRMLHLRGIAHRLGLLRKIWLSPELSEFTEMQELSKTFIKMGIPVLNMAFHSTSLVPGLSPFVKTIKDLQEFYKRLELFFIWLCNNYNVKSVTLSEYYQIFNEKNSAVQSVISHQAKADD